MKKTRTEASDTECQKEAVEFFDRFDRTERKEELYHAAAHVKSDWLLSTANVDGTPRVPNGLVRGMKPFSTTDDLLLLMPLEVTHSLSLVEFHQITKELLIGIYVFNQLPALKFEPNHDGTTTCVLPSAYTNTLIGTTLLSVAYYIESLLHGSTIPKEKHSKTMECWKTMSAKSDPMEILKDGGLVDMKEELGDDDLYKDPQPHFPRYPEFGVDHDLADRDLPKRPSTEEIYSSGVDTHCTEVFQKLLKQVSLSLVLSPNSYQQHKNMFVMDVAWDVETDFASLSSEVDEKMFFLLQAYLQRQRDFVKSRLKLKASICHEMDLLCYVAYMVPLLVTLKKKNRVIKKSGLLPGPSVERLHTEKNIPPLVPSQDSRWTSRTSQQYGFLNSSIQFYKQHWESESPSSEMSLRYQQLMDQARESNLTHEEDYPVTSLVTFKDQKYCLLLFELEEFYLKSPRVPLWVHSMMHELKTSSSHLQALNDVRIQEYFHKPLGPKKAYKIKGVNLALQASIERGLVAPTAALLKRCTNTRLNKLTDENLAFIHYTALAGRDIIMGQLIASGCDPQIKYQIPNRPLGQESTPVHLAAQSGRIDAVFCLLTAGCSVSDYDDRGWAPIHYAAYHNNQNTVKFLWHCDPDFLNLATTDNLRLTPLLLSITSGGLDTVKALVRRGADVTVTSAKGENCIRLAAYRNLVNVLLFMKDLPALKEVFWVTLKDMLEEDVKTGAVTAAVRVLDPLTKCGPDQYTFIHNSGIVPPLVKLLQESEQLQSLASQVLRNISNFDAIRVDMIEAGAVPHIVKLLNSPRDDVQSCACILLCDLTVKGKQSEVASEGAIPLLKKLLTSESEDVVLYSCAALGILARDHSKNQALIVEEGCLPPVIDLLDADKPCIAACAAHTLSVVVKESKQNQVKAISVRCKGPLLLLLKEPDFSVHCNAALAIERITDQNHRCQQHFFKEEACITSLVRLLKMVNIEVKLRGASALWAIAGGSLADKRVIAVKMDISCLVDTIGLGCEPLDYICGEALGSLASEMGHHQTTIYQVGGITQLIHILRTNASERVFLCMLHCLSALITKPALVPNTDMQKTVSNINGLCLLVQIMKNNKSNLVRANAACALAKLCLCCSENQEFLKNDPDFDLKKVFAFATSTDPSVRLVGGEAISVFVYNNPPMLQRYQKLGRIEYAHYQQLLCLNNQEQQASAAFQITVLSKLLVGISAGQACVQGIKMLVHLIWLDTEETKILCCEYLGRLAHSYDGLPQVIVGAGGVNAMITCLKSRNEPVMRGAASVLGYLSYCHVGRRLILTAFRDEPYLFCVFINHLYHKKVCPVFLSMWKDTEKDGLPALGLEQFGGQPVEQKEQTVVFTDGSQSFAESKLFTSFIKSSIRHSQEIPATSNATTNSLSKHHRLTRRRSAVIATKSSLLVGTGPLMKRKLLLPSLNDTKKFTPSIKPANKLPTTGGDVKRR